MGRDAAREAYRLKAEIAGRELQAFVPECLMQGLRLDERPTHQEAYEWIARHSAALHTAIAARAENRAPRKPYHLVTLIEETEDAH